MVLLNFILIFLLVKFMPPARAVALSTVLTDFFSAASSALFYRRTAARMDREQRGEEAVVSVDSR
jgi:hypothetical protein